jgi:ATP-dependent RNA helicase DDX49/DBP8
MSNEPSFEGLKLKNWLIKQCQAVGIKKPTPIQEHCVPAILEGRDCIGCAKTGSGKTLASFINI